MTRNDRDVDADDGLTPYLPARHRSLETEADRVAHNREVIRQLREEFPGVPRGSGPSTAEIIRQGREKRAEHLMRVHEEARRRSSES